MRDNRSKWQFYTSGGMAALTPEETFWWKRAASTLLKVGIEFEYNLPEPKTGCKGDDPLCACKNIETDNCWARCANRDACAYYGITPSTCCLFPTDCRSTNPKDCKSCDRGVFKCIGQMCVDFVPFCVICNKKNTDCKSCKKKVDPKKDPGNIRESLHIDLSPSGKYGRIVESGVFDIKKDGSLLGDHGVEIITIGRRIDYWEFYGMSKRIIDKVVGFGGYTNERTSMHMHVLTSYYEREDINEMERPMPQIILANFHQLVRRYQNALTWMTMALEDPNAMTRWEKYRVSVLDISAVTRDMPTVSSDVSRVAGGNKYGFVNYLKTKFKANGDVERLHVEFRESDSVNSPSYCAAIACLHYAFVLKAIEISRYGILKVGSKEWLQNAKDMKEIIMNGKGDWSSKRTSDTSKLLDHKQYFVEESLDMISQMKNILMKIGPAYDVLVKLAKTPVAIRRIEGKSFSQIEEDLCVQRTRLGILEQKIDETIDLRIVDQCKDLNEWLNEIYKVVIDGSVDVDKSEIDNVINYKMREGEAVWSEALGCVIPV